MVINNNSTIEIPLTKGKRPFLGKKIAEFRSQPINIKNWLLLIIPTGLLTLLCFTYGILLAGNAFQQHGPALALSRARSWLIFGTVLLIFLAVYILSLVVNSFIRLQIFSEGISYRNRILQKRAYYWSDLSGITSSATRSTLLGRDLRTIPGGTIFPKIGKPIVLPKRLAGIPKLIKLIKSNIYPLLWPDMKTRFLNGDILEFGHVSMNKDYLSMANKQIPWNMVKKLWVDSGYLVVEIRQNSSKRLPLSKILNLELFLKVVDWGFQT